MVTNKLVKIGEKAVLHVQEKRGVGSMLVFYKIRGERQYLDGAVMYLRIKFPDIKFEDVEQMSSSTMKDWFRVGGYRKLPGAFNKEKWNEYQAGDNDERPDPVG